MWIQEARRLRSRAERAAWEVGERRLLRWAPSRSSPTSW
jgi:hypothetical protein